MGRAFYRKLFLMLGMLTLCFSIIGSVLFFSNTPPAHAQELSAGGFASSFWQDLTSGQVETDLLNGISNPGAVAGAVRDTARNLSNGQSLSDAVSNAGSTMENEIQNNELFPCDLTDIICKVTRMVMQIITGLLGLIVNFLGFLVTFAIKILIGFAKYNGFANAAPVTMGWVVVRDLVNMFFIVILLVSAFATIIGYESSFHYTKVLPKLLLMAVLINFSKTLIMLLVDLSQVVMLTFVNAFQQASGANFIRAFKLDKITQMANCNGQQSPIVGSATSTGGGTGAAGALNTATSTASRVGAELTNTACGTQAAITMTNIILAYLLGIVLLIIALGVIIIMIAYLIARIVGLWIVLIFSPIAFFATAVPARLQKGLSTFTGKYWEKLSALLTGGPVMAFFLWLTLATMQSAGNSLPSQGVASTAESGGSAFINGVGNSQDLATFIVAIAMLMMGLDAAVSAAKQTSDTVGQFAGNVAGFTTKAAKFAAMSPLYLGRSGARAVDRRVDLTGKVSRGLLKVPIVRDIARKPLVKGAVMRRKEREAMANEEIGDMKDMTRDEKLSLARSMGDVTGSPHEMLARAKIYEDLGSDESRFKDTKSRAAQYEAEMKNDSRYNGMAPDEIKRQANARALRDATVEGGQHLAEARSGYLANGDMNKVADIDKTIEKNPMLERNETKRTALLNKIRLDPDKMKALSAEALSDPTVVMAMLPPGAVQMRGNNVTGFDSAQFEAFKEQNKDNQALVSNLDAIANHIDNTPGGVNRNDFNSAMMQRDNRGNVSLYNTQSGERMMSGNERIARDDFNRDVVNATGGGRTTPGNLSGAASDAVRQAVGSGVPLAEVLRNGNDASDRAVTGSLGNDMHTAFAAARTAGNKADLDTALAGQANVVSQLEGPDISADVQVRILSDVHTAGGAEAIANQWQQADRNQRRMFEQMVKIMAARASDIAAKRAASGPASITAEEHDVEDMLADLRARMPQTAVRNAAGAVVTQAAPPALRQHLHG